MFWFLREPKVGFVVAAVAACGCSNPPINPRSLIGSWQSLDSFRTIAFNQNHTYASSLATPFVHRTVPQLLRSSSGKWSATDSALTITPTDAYGNGEPLSEPYKTQTYRFTLTDNGRTLNVEATTPTRASLGIFIIEGNEAGPWRYQR